MQQNKKLKLFIGYSHLDEKPYIEQFKRHIAPLKDNGLIEEWYDRKILPGEDYQNKIDNNLEDADIINLFISANFLASVECKKEIKKASDLRKKNGISVIPIILSPCGWSDNKDLSKLLALPTDGKPVSSFQTSDEAWYDVYNGLKGVIEKDIEIRQAKIKEEFKNFLQSTEMLTKAHSQKESVFLDDIFVYPELDKYDVLREYVEKISSEKLFHNLLDYPKIVISGEALSGKTTLCKVIFKILRENNFIPIYVADKENHFRGRIKNIILRSFRKQYEGIEISKIDRDRIVPIIDDFHFATNIEKNMENLSKYSRSIVIVDDIFCLNVKEEKLISSFDSFKIREFKPSLRYELIKKWESLTDKGTTVSYKDLDEKVELVESTLGKMISKGIVPSYPFYILSTIVAYEISTKPLDQEITSQGYCYQALIYFYLRKQGVKNDEMDIYINFLTEIAFYFFKEKKKELSTNDFIIFMNTYLEKYNLPIKPETLLKNLRQIILVDSFNNYSFRYLYLYYFFVAKYLSEHIKDTEVEAMINNIMKNLHVDENAYIAIFMVHHSKNISILDEIELNALIL